MRRFAKALCALVLTCPVLSAGADVPPGWDAGRFMGVDEIRPGMRGIGRSVFSGSAVEEFDVEILGVLPTAAPEGEMILARLSGHDLERTGVIAGMSGSPIYIDGRLIGALAFGWSFSTTPITGITPISSMLDLRRREEGVRGAGRAPGDETRSGPRAGLPPEAWERLWTAQGGEVLDLLLGDEGEMEARGELTPLRVPIGVGGFGMGTERLLGRWLERAGFLPVQAGGAGSTTRTAGPLEPGSAVGVELVRGDAQLAAVGTVTWVDGDEIFAFGHPMLGRGGSEYPLAAADIVTVMPRLSSSFKMGVVGEELGAVTRDFRSGITGRLGGRAAMIPVQVKTARAGVESAYRFEVLDAAGLTPGIVGLLAVNVMESMGASTGEATLRVHTSVTLAGGRTVEQDKTVAGFSPPEDLAGEVARLVGIIHGNPLEVVRLEGVEVAVEVVDEVQAAFLERIEVEPGPFAPGGNIPLRAWFRDYRGETWHHDLRFVVPPAVGDGDYDLLVCDGGGANRAEQERAPALFAPRTLTRVLEILAAEVPEDQLVLRLLDSRTSPVVAGEELPGLPVSRRATLATSLISGRATTASRTILAEQREGLGRMLLGCRGVSVHIESPRE